MAYNSKYTGAQVEALLDRAGSAPQTYDIGWLTNLISTSADDTVTLTAEQFNEIKAAADAHKMFIASGTVWWATAESKSDPGSGETRDGISLLSAPSSTQWDSNSYGYSTIIMQIDVFRATTASGSVTYGANNKRYRLVDRTALSVYARISTLQDYALKSTLQDYAKASDVPTKTSQLTNDSGFLTEHQSLDGYVRKREVVKTFPSIIGYGTSYTAAIPSIELSANKFNIVGRCSGLTLTLPAGADMDGQEYCCQFYVPNQDYTLTVPADVRWQNGEVPTFEGNTCYQLVIVNNCATIGVFKASS